ncbi:hypothetical protein [uncultured Sphingomonas sp.]|uniref:hypothetical protein n=1 Tax=uncultured Sphingomonas sp. TaxID=158754 RepID=UPI0025FF923D|nr:hypothetical protein [uncultured Sphingomonas sp.]
MSSRAMLSVVMVGVSDRRAYAFYNEERRLSVALNEVPIGDAIAFAGAMKVFASGLEDVL